jgi:hypothetical protein
VACLLGLRYATPNTAEYVRSNLIRYTVVIIYVYRMYDLRFSQQSSLPDWWRFLAWLILQPWRWRRHVPPKRRLTFNGLHGVLSQKIQSFTVYPVWGRLWCPSVPPGKCWDSAFCHILPTLAVQVICYIGDTADELSLHLEIRNNMGSYTTAILHSLPLKMKHVAVRITYVGAVSFSEQGPEMLGHIWRWLFEKRIQVLV